MIDNSETKDELMRFFSRLKSQRAIMTCPSEVSLSFLVFPDNGQIQARDGIWNKGVMGLSFFSDMPNIDDELAGLLFDLSMTHTIRAIEIGGESFSQMPSYYQIAHIKVQLALAPSEDHTTNIDADVIEEVLGMMKSCMLWDIVSKRY